MGMTIILEREDGTRLPQSVADVEHDLLALFYKLTESDGFHYLQYVDPYGFTVLNRLQMEPFLRELAHLQERELSAKQRSLVAALQALALICSKEIHVYLRFIGD